MNKNRFTFGAIVLAAGIAGGAAACGGGGGGAGGTITGTVGGAKVTIVDSISAKATSGSGSDAQSFGLVVMSNIDGLCGEAMTMSDVSHKNSQVVFIQVANVDATAQTVTAPTAPGTFTVFDSSGSGAPPAMAAVLDVSSDDATCMTDAAHSSSGVSGTVTLTAVSGDKFSGSYDVMLASGDHVTGTFSPDACQALETIFQDSGSGSGSGSAVCQ